MPLNCHTIPAAKDFLHDFRDNLFMVGFIIASKEKAEREHKIIVFCTLWDFKGH